MRACKVCRYFYNLLVALDQLASAIVGGDPDETLSSRFGKAARQGNTWAHIVCRLLDLVHEDHCQWSIERDEGRKAIWRWYEQTKEGR